MHHEFLAQLANHVSTVIKQDEMLILYPVYYNVTNGYLTSSQPIMFVSPTNTIVRILNGMHTRRCVHMSGIMCVDKINEGHIVSKTLAFKSSTPVSVNQFAFAVPTPSYLVKSAQFLHSEIPVRVARRIRELESLPFGLSHHVGIKSVLESYQIALHDLYSRPVPTDVDSEEEYTEVIRKAIMVKNAVVLRNLADALNDVANTLQLEDASMVLLQEFVDSFVRSRLSLRLLVLQHIAMHNKRKGWVGVVSDHCDAPSIVAEAVRDAQEACERALGVAPRVSINGETTQFRFVPSHLRYILFELLKNALRAVVEFHPEVSRSQDYPPIKVVVAVSKVGDVCFKISDQGGGFARNTPVMSWVYSTGRYILKESQSDESTPISTTTELGETVDMVNNADFAGSGYGLPVARLYARFFHGDVKLFPMLNYGTDVYFHVKMLTNSNEPLMK